MAAVFIWMQIGSDDCTRTANHTDILNPIVVAHFDNHHLRSRPVYMVDDARPHRERVVAEFLQVALHQIK